MKLIIQIPCFNEEKTLGLVLKDLPKKVKGIDDIEVQIIDDGSTDGTVGVARRFGVDRIISHVGNKGLGKAFSDGVDAALKAGADILINTDGDNQYPGMYIDNLVVPILEKRAHIVIADRKTDEIKHFSLIKKKLQKFGSLMVRFLSGVDVPDAVSGFRAYSRKAMLELNVVSKYSYCIDTIVQAGKKDLKIVSIPITTNEPTRKSRLFKNIWQHVGKSLVNLLRVFVVYEPFKTFLILAIIFLIPALILTVRFLYVYFFIRDQAGGHIQSLILASAFLTCSVQLFVLGILADLVSINRWLIERLMRYEKER